jgi:hypothetical protein
MLRKMLTFGALALVAVAFGVGSASAAHHGQPNPGWHFGQVGFSDGRLAE